MEDSVSEAIEVANAEGNTFQEFRFVVAALGEAVGIGTIKGSKDFIRPVVDSFRTGKKFRKSGFFGNLGIKWTKMIDRALDSDSKIGNLFDSMGE